MAKNRLIYIAVLTGVTVFCLSYRQWLGWLIFLAVLALPWFSLALSLPAMIRFRVTPSGPDRLEMGEPADFLLMGHCPFPMPAFRGRLGLRRCFDRKYFPYRDDTSALTAHCGGIRVTAEKVRICDYLGLFSLPVRKKESCLLLVRPRPLPLSLPEDLLRQTALGWKPRFSGFAENHELRLYRPGDSLNRVHWKLSAKTGGLILREPAELIRGQMLLTMNLRGDPEALDRKFGRLLWLGSHLLDQNTPFEIRCLTESGVLSFPVSAETELDAAVDCLLCQETAPAGDLGQQHFAAVWRYHIGGEPDEG